MTDTCGMLFVLSIVIVLRFFCVPFLSSREGKNIIWFT